jgi:hypothetical protein
MSILKNQNGGSYIGWLILLVLIIIIGVPGMKIVPVYLKDMKIDGALKNLEADTVKAQAESTVTSDKIKRDLLNRYALKDIPEITDDDITVTETSDNFIVRIQHEFKVRIILDKYFTLNVDRSAEIPIIIKR